VKVVRCGVTRTVILVGRYAVKVPTLRGVHPGGPRGRLAGVARGLLANQSEALWSTYEPFQGLVAPVLRSWLGGLVQVYPRCVPVPDAFDLPAGAPVLDPSPGDSKPDNLGWLDGRLVWLDYEM
jgi:hypothetical protein